MARYQGLGFKHMHERIVHLNRECPEGKIIAIAKRDGVKTNDPEAMKGLELCEWCQAKDQAENPR
jgi:hypothetical protein